MAQQALNAPDVVAPRRGRIASNGVVGMVIFVIAEVMFFAGLMSAFTIVKASRIGAWPPPDQPRLPVEETALNTVALLLSGVALFFAHKRFKEDRSKAAVPLLVAMALGAFFVLFQGAEWVALIREGLTLKSSTHGGFFYLIVGAHGLHAVAALGALGYVYYLLSRKQLDSTAFVTVQIFWYFVVAVWPFLYWRVYL